MYAHENSTEPKLVEDDDDPASVGSSQAMSSIVCTTIIDAVLQAFLLLWLVVACADDGDTIDVDDGPTRLSLLHSAHWIIILTACCTFPCDVLVMPILFGIVGFGVALVDVFVLVQRVVLLTNATQVDFGCNFALLLLDIAFLAIALSYAIYSLVSLSRFGHNHVKAETRSARALLALVDTVLLFLLFLLIVLVCLNGQLPDDGDTALLHLGHVLLILSACVGVQIDSLLVPAWLIVTGIAVAVFDVLALLDDVSDVDLTDLTTLASCVGFRILFDLAFIVTALGYAALGLRATAFYGLCGNLDDGGEVFVSDSERPADESDYEGRAKLLDYVDYSDTTETTASSSSSKQKSAKAIVSALMAGPPPAKYLAKVV